MLPESKLPELHPMFQIREEVPREMKEIGNALKLKYRASHGMGEVLKRSGLEQDYSSKSANSDIKSRYKQLQERFLQAKENSKHSLHDSTSPVKAARFLEPVQDQQYHL